MGKVKEPSKMIPFFPNFTSHLTLPLPFSSQFLLDFIFPMGNSSLAIPQHMSKSQILGTFNKMGKALNKAQTTTPGLRVPLLF